MTTLVKAGLDTPIDGVDDLIRYLADRARPRNQWGIGAESEKLVLDARSGEAASFARIEALLERLLVKGARAGIREDGRLIALVNNASSITLEPGGQLELSGELCGSIHCCYRDFVRHYQEVTTEAQALDLVFLGLGTQPFTPLDKIDWVPKERYRIMGPYMLRTGRLGQAMMKQTAGVQINVDFSDERDWLLKMRLSLLLSPILYALFANSPLRDGRPSGFLSTRGDIWANTDAQRTGLLPQLFSEDAGYADFVAYALEVPMYFIRRDGRFLDFTQRPVSFRRYLQQGWSGQRATLADWDLHLSTIFTEVRVRPQIELRSADSLPPRYTLAVAALVKGLLYDDEALDQSLHLLSRELQPRLDQVTRQSWRLGLRTPVGTRTLREISLELLAVARSGLKRQGICNAQGLDESIYLQSVQELAERGQTLAERLLEGWQGSRQNKLQWLIKHCGFVGGESSILS